MLNAMIVNHTLKSDITTILMRHSVQESTTSLRRDFHFVTGYRKREDESPLALQRIYFSIRCLLLLRNLCLNIIAESANDFSIIWKTPENLLRTNESLRYSTKENHINLRIFFSRVKNPSKKILHIFLYIIFLIIYETFPSFFSGNNKGVARVFSVKFTEFRCNLF